MEILGNGPSQNIGIIHPESKGKTAYLVSLMLQEKYIFWLREETGLKFIKKASIFNYFLFTRKKKHVF